MLVYEIFIQNWFKNSKVLKKAIFNNRNIYSFPWFICQTRKMPNYIMDGLFKKVN